MSPIIQAIVQLAHGIREAADVVSNALSPFGNLAVDVLAFVGLRSLLDRDHRNKRRGA